MAEMKRKRGDLSAVMSAGLRADDQPAADKEVPAEQAADEVRDASGYTDAQLREKHRWSTYVPLGTLGRAKAAWPHVHSASARPGSEWRAVDGTSYGSLADWVADLIERAVQEAENDLNNGERFEIVREARRGRPARN